jgi:predicted secreted acid phosphatase
MAHIATAHSIIDQSTGLKVKFSCIFCMRKFKTNRTLKCHQNKYQQRAKIEHKFYDCQSCKEKFCVMKDNLQEFLDKKDKTTRYRCVKCIEEKAKKFGKRFQSH